MVLKPSEVASITCLELGNIADKAGLPPGVLNIITGLGTSAGAPLRWAGKALHTPGSLDLITFWRQLKPWWRAGTSASFAANLIAYLCSRVAVLHWILLWLPFISFMATPDAPPTDLLHHLYAMPAPHCQTVISDTTVQPSATPYPALLSISISAQKSYAQNPIANLAAHQHTSCSSHPGVAKVAFTGSVATGRAVNLAAAKNLRPATMELGGKGPIIVFPDVDVDKAVEWVAVRHLFRP